jgi:hypothetical protein
MTDEPQDAVVVNLDDPDADADFEASFDDPPDDVVVPSSQRPHTVVAWDVDGTPVTQAQFDDHIAENGRTSVAVPDAALMGAPSVPAPDAPAAGDVGQLPDDVVTVPQVVAYIKAGADESEDEAIRRAGIAWSAEATREGGVRAGVEEEVDRWLVTEPGQ